MADHNLMMPSHGVLPRLRVLLHICRRVCTVSGALLAAGHTHADVLDTFLGNRSCSPLCVLVPAGRSRHTLRAAVRTYQLLADWRSVTNTQTPWEHERPASGCRSCTRLLHDERPLPRAVFSNAEQNTVRTTHCHHQ